MENSLRLKSKICTCEENYIAETKRNFEIRWGKNSDINKISEPPQHLKSNPTHAFIWKVLISLTINDRVRKSLETSFIALSRPSLIEQIDSKKLLLCQNGVT